MMSWTLVVHGSLSLRRTWYPRFEKPEGWGTRAAMMAPTKKQLPHRRFARIGMTTFFSNEKLN
jgi:hypothetical protein